MSTGDATRKATPAGTEPALGPGSHRYNDDLLIGAAARERARRELPTLIHVLDFDALRDEFKSADGTANRRKRRAQVAGFWAVVAALISLCGTACEPLWSRAPSPWPVVLAGLFAFVGIVGFAIAAVGLLYGKHKAEWLRLRLKTERLRQFQFQTFLFKLSEIIDSTKSETTRDDYRASRMNWFDSFKSRLQSGTIGELARVIDPEKPPTVWVHGDTRTAPVFPTAASGLDLSDVFRAYSTFRFDEQSGYAAYMLRKNNEPSAGSDHASAKSRSKKRRPWYPGIDQPIRVKRDFLKIVSAVTLVTLIVLHVLVLVGSLASIEALHELWVGIVVLLLAIVAVAAKTLTEGLGLQRDIERYEEYGAEVDDLRNRFRAATDNEERFRIMVEMERVAYEEMRAFLRSHEEATFVM